MAVVKPSNGAAGQSKDTQQIKASISQGIEQLDLFTDRPTNDGELPSRNSSQMPSAVKEQILVRESPYHQLPSPSPSPSPISTSPSFELSSGDLEEVGLSNDGTLSSPSFQQYATAHGDDTAREILMSPKPISKSLPINELSAIPEEKPKSRRKPSITKPPEDKTLKLSPAEIEELTSAPESLPFPLMAHSGSQEGALLSPPLLGLPLLRTDLPGHGDSPRSRGVSNPLGEAQTMSAERSFDVAATGNRPNVASRTISTPVMRRQDSSWTSSAKQPSPVRRPIPSASRPDPLELTLSTRSGSTRPRAASESDGDIAPQAIPLPPMSIPTYLQLELASTRPSPLYIYRPSSSEYPYESSRIKFERLLNFLLLPPQLEQVLCFGALACLDAWLSTFTILPLRFLKACTILISWWISVVVREARFISGFIYHGSGRMWHRQRGRTLDSASVSRSTSRSSRPNMSTNPSYLISSRVPDGAAAVVPAVINGAAEKLRMDLERKSRPQWGRRHRRAKSQPSALSSYHKADLLNGLVIIASSMIMMTFDASRMYHSIRGQSAMKLYVLYNLIEVNSHGFFLLVITNSQIGRRPSSCSTWPRHI